MGFSSQMKMISNRRTRFPPEDRAISIPTYCDLSGRSCESNHVSQDCGSFKYSETNWMRFDPAVKKEVQLTTSVNVAASS